MRKASHMFNTSRTYVPLYFNAFWYSVTDWKSLKRGGALIGMVQPISAQCCFSYRNQSIILQSKINDWFLYDTQHWAEMG